MTLLLALAACAPVFDQSRKDLADFRLLAMALDGDVPRAAVWSGHGAWHPTAPTLTWEDAEWAAGDDPVRWHELSLHAEDAEGHAEDGLLEVDEGHANPVVSGFMREVADRTATLALDAPDGASTRWASTGGTFTETGPHAATWEAGADGLATIFALTMDGEGGNTWTWIDVAVNTDGPFLAVGGRLLPLDAAPVEAEGTFLATLSAADTLSGVLLTDVEAGTGGDVVCGLDPFDPDALADGRCGRDEAEGARVALAGTVTP